jgi:protein-S-isoprenylcysteine O-methyltransferase Ste14
MAASSCPKSERVSKESLRGGGQLGAHAENGFANFMNNLYFRVIRATVGGAVAFLAIIFIPAWTLDYWQGWVFAGTLSVSSILVTIYMALHDKKLLESRLRAGPIAEKSSAQKIITAVGLLFFVGAVVIMVLDHRFGWSPPVPAYLSILGDALGVLGILIYFLVVRENHYAASTIEVVEGQTVVSTGPYAIVRHPMYAGAILVFVGTPLALGSWCGLLFTPLFFGWFAWRLLNEEQFLRTNLLGYEEYTRKVHYRLAPHIW